MNIGYTKSNNSIWTKMPVVVLTAVFCCVLSGSASLAIKIAYELFGIPVDDTPSRLVLMGGEIYSGGGDDDSVRIAHCEKDADSG